MCKCKKREFGIYENQVILVVPDDIVIEGCNGRKTEISVDACIADEIQYLWSQGIRTTGCCCGHNWMYGYIGVYFEDIPKMKALGYKPQRNMSRGMDCKDEDSFFPKKYYIYEEVD